MWALVPAVVLTIAAVLSLTSSQARAEADPEPEQTICEGLYSLTMGVNIGTLHRMGELTKYSHSTDRKCRVSLTLRYASSEAPPAGTSKTCTVTMTPMWKGPAIDLDIAESGECDRVATEAVIEIASDKRVWAAYSESAEDTGKPADSADSTEPAVHGASGCRFSSWADWPHVSRNGRDTSVHGWWEDDSSFGCPRYADVTVLLQAHWCHVPARGQCWWQTIAYNKQRVRARDHGGQRVNARDYCRPATALVGYRGVVDVDLVGQSDPPDKVYTIPRNLLCNPPLPR